MEKNCFGSQPVRFAARIQEQIKFMNRASIVLLKFYYTAYIYVHIQCIYVYVYIYIIIHNYSCVKFHYSCVKFCVCVCVGACVCINIARMKSAPIIHTQAERIYRFAGDLNLH